MTIQTDGNLEIQSLMLRQSDDPIGIVDGVAALTQSYGIIAAESSTTDNLDTITLDESGSYNPLFFLRASAGHAITLRDSSVGSGNIETPGANPVTMTDDTPVWCLYDEADDKVYVLPAAGSGGSGDVVGPGSSTDNAIARFDSTTGKLLQNTAQTTVSDNGAIATDLNADAIGLWIQQHSTQTANPFEIEDSAGNNQIVFTPDGGAIFNEEGNDADFRVETDGNANTLFVDGENNNIGIGTDTPNASALLDLVSTAKGLGLPVMTEAERDAIGTPRDGLMIYNSDDDTANLRANGAWVQLGAGGGSSNTVSGTHTEGSNYTSTAGVFVDVDAVDVSDSITITGSGTVIGWFSCVCSKDTNGRLELRVTDGTNNSDLVTHQQASGSQRVLVPFRLTGLTGTVTIKLQFNSQNANNATISNTSDPITWVMWEE